MNSSIHKPVGAFVLTSYARKASIILLSVVIIAACVYSGTPAYADSLSLGSVLPNFTVVSVGPKASIMLNSGPITGNVLLGDGTTSNSSGGGNGQVTGVVDVSPTVSGDDLTHLQIAPTVVTVPSAEGVTAFDDAINLSIAAAALTPTQTFTQINGPTTIKGNGGLNVIDVGSLQNPTLTISGTASDTFVFNISGFFNTNQAITLNGVTASQILWNLTGTSGNVLQTSGGDVLYGTFLATDGGNFQFSALDLKAGELINTDGNMQIVSNSKIESSQPFSPVPEPATLTMLAVGLAGLSWLRARRYA